MSSHEQSHRESCEFSLDELQRALGWLLSIVMSDREEDALVKDAQARLGDVRVSVLSLPQEVVFGRGVPLVNTTACRLAEHPRRMCYPKCLMENVLPKRS